MASPQSRLLSFVTAEEDLWIKTSCPLNEVTAVFMLKNLCYQYLLCCATVQIVRASILHEQLLILSVTALALTFAQSPCTWLWLLSM